MTQGFIAPRIVPAIVPEDFGITEGMELTAYANTVWFDPGGTTGWAIFSIHPDALDNPELSVLDNINHWSCGQFTGLENVQVRHALDLITVWEDAAIGIEDFVLRVHSTDRSVLAPVRVTAAIEFEMWCGNTGSTPIDADRSLPSRKILKQQPSLAMDTVTDDRLKRWGFYARTVGSGHGRDAVRHALTFLRRAKGDAALRTDAWPLRFE